MKLRHYLSLGIAALILIGSFFLPNAVATITDARRIDHLVFADSEQINFDTAPDLSLIERIALAGNANTEILPMSTGNVLNSETAAQAAMRETSRFFSGGAFAFYYDELTADEGIVSLIIDIPIPARYILVWQFDITDVAGNSVTVTIDDETGIIVRLVYRMGSRDESLIDLGQRATNDELFYTAARRLADMMAVYYGHDVILADYQFSGSGNLSYYRADISDAGQIVPMYGVVRRASFSLNERV